MKKNIYNLLALVFTLFFLQSRLLAQQPALDGRNQNALRYIFHQKKISEKQTTDNTIGSVYNDSSWQIGNVYLNNNEVMKDVKIRYNLHTQQLEVLQKELYNIPGMVRDKHLKGFSFGDSSKTSSAMFFKYTWKSDDDQEESGLLQVFENEGNFTLYKKKYIVFKKATYVPSLQVGSREDEWVKKEQWMIGLKGEIHPMPSRKSKIIKLFSGYKIDTQPYFKANSFNAKDGESIIEFIDWVEKNQ